MGMKAALTAFAAAGCVAAATAEPAVKVIYFTASWCSNCRVLGPRIDEAMAGQTEGQAQLVKVDLSKMFDATIDERLAMVKTAEDTLLAHEARYLWDWYGGYTGIAAIVAADTGEPLSCVMRVMAADDIAERIDAGIKAVETLPAGARRPEGPDCPAPTRVLR